MGGAGRMAGCVARRRRARRPRLRGALAIYRERHR